MGKYGTRYGASLRKIIKKIRANWRAHGRCATAGGTSSRSSCAQPATQFCHAACCPQFAVKRQAVGIWACKACGKVTAGGAYVLR